MRDYNKMSEREREPGRKGGREGEREGVHACKYLHIIVQEHDVCIVRVCP